MKRAAILLFAVILLCIIGWLIYKSDFFAQKNENELILFGNIDVRQVDVGFRVFGRLEKMIYEEGDEVSPGELLAILDKQPFEEQVLQGQAHVESLRVLFNNAKLLYERRLDLKDSGAVSQEDFDDSLAQKNQAEANLEEAIAALAYLMTNLGDTQVYCPSQGSVLTRVREPGSVVKAGDPVYMISIASPVWVRAYVNEPNLGRIFPGMLAEVFTDTTRNHPYRGHIGFISPVAEFTPKTVETTQLRTDLVYRLRVIVDNPDRNLRQGMPVTVKLNLHETQDREHTLQPLP
jgi:HlyD family secretion protein